LHVPKDGDRFAAFEQPADDPATGRR